jgi:hypothetical protein
MTAPQTSPRASAPTPISVVDLEALEALEEAAENGFAQTHESPRHRRERVVNNGRTGTAHVRGALKRDVARRSAPPAVDRPEREPDEVDLAGMDSFPASDPPSFWTHDPAPAPAKQSKKETA